MRFIPALIVLLLIFLCCPVSSALRFTYTPHTPSCSLRSSRKARALLQDLMFDHLPSDYELPETCPFRPEYDFTQAFEAQREKIRPAVWRCGLCSKQFKGEQWIDGHIERSHLNETVLPEPNPAIAAAASPRVCLADYCPILDCDHRESSRYQETRTQSRHRRESKNDLPEAEESSGEIPPCNPAQVERDRLECFNVLSKCFPVSSSSGHSQSASSGSSAANSFHQQFSASICGHLQCDPTGNHIGREKLKKNKEKYESTRLKWIFIGILLVSSMIYYFFLWVFRNEKYSTVAFSSSTRSKYEIPWWMCWKKWGKKQERPKLF